jgi:sulfate adenylyltransferase
LPTPADRALSTIIRGSDGLIAPHGGKLHDLLVKDAKEAAALVASCNGRSMELSDRGACDVELLTVGRVCV